jgi:hypothetical protein
VEAAAAARAALEAGWARESAGARVSAPPVAAPAAPPSPGSAVRPAPEEARPPGARVLIVLTLARAEVDTIAGALGLSRFEAGQLAVRGGPHLHRIVPLAAAQGEAARLRAAGLEVLEVPEDEVRRAEPLPATRGGPAGDALELDGPDGPLRLAAADVSLIVLGPITRDYPTTAAELRRLQTATLEPGYRVHLHRRHDPRPVELDPAAFDFGPGGASGGAQRQMLTWIDRLFPDARRDDSFRVAIPALAPATPPAGAAQALASTRRDARPVLDNLAQFRFHSAWRAAARRRLER